VNSPNFDLALIYNTGGAFEKVASQASGQVQRPTLADYAVYVCYGDDVPDEIDLEKVAKVHEFMLDADRTGRAEAQMAFSELEDRFLQGDPEAAAQMQAFFSTEPEKVAHQDPLVAAARAELERRVAEGLQKEAFVGKLMKSYSRRGAKASARANSLMDAANARDIEQTVRRTVVGERALLDKPMEGPLPRGKVQRIQDAAVAGRDLTSTGRRIGANVRAFGREFAPELAVAGTATGLGVGLAAGNKNKKTTVVYR
jgi:hypothetical protein